jgi:hypothetical protein
MTFTIHLTWNYLVYPLAGVGVLAILFIIWACRQSW